MTIHDAHLKERYGRNISLLAKLGNHTEDFIPIIALMEAFQFLSLTQGAESRSAKEAVEQLLSKELRIALRKWYSISGKDMNETALAFRERLSELAGERFG